ncbi:hypothetical protein SH1V18_30650 [Vallitalea longa]|uniref:SLH domain-containing protein n=1 Tax=Vallitalea longa TaxID=2936439 RepID=A0A9W6DFH2_9FIRM|nr:S-layer homology domain-containing protein [Vallitalea longa]GKX30585.1 hypothetical protein SH1V18_30650 [Vallitalea longa]
MKKPIILLVVISSLLINTVFVNAANRVIYDFTQYSDTSGEIQLTWKEDNNENIQIISYYLTKDNILEVTYRAGNDVPDGFNKRTIDGINFPVKIILQEQKVDNDVLIDLPDDKTNRYDILNLYNRGIINGYNDNSFKPDSKVTRAEFFAMLVATAGYEIDTDSKSVFSDVNNDFWGKKYIMTLANKGVVSGDGNGLCNPNGEITIGEVLAIIDRTFTFYDQSRDYIKPTVIHWSNDNFINTAKADIVWKSDDFYNPYTPNMKATRLQCATLLSRVLQTNYCLK